MTDDGRRRIECLCDLLHVADVICNRVPANLAFTPSMSAQTKCGDVITVVSKEGQEELVPAPRAMPHPVDKEQGRFVCSILRRAGDGFDSHGFSSDGRLLFHSHCNGLSSAGDEELENPAAQL